MLIDRFILQIVDFSPAVQAEIIDRFQQEFAVAVRVARGWSVEFSNDVAELIAGEHRCRLRQISNERGRS